MKKSFLILALMVATGSLFAQKKTTTSATVAFDATTSLDNLPKAENKTTIAALDTKAGSLAFEANVKNFAFANPTMQGHFNSEAWLSSDKFPTFTFTGNLTKPADVDFTKDGTYKTTVEGTLTIKGIDKKITAPATFVIQNGAINAKSNFIVKVADYGISGVPIDAGKVSKEAKVTVNADFK